MGSENRFFISNAFKSITLIAFLSCLTLASSAQSSFDAALALKVDSLIAEKATFQFVNQFLVPNNNVQSIATPTGWGSGNTSYAFVIVGSILPALYVDPEKPDLIGAAGVGFGNSQKYVSVSASVNVTRVSELRDLSANLIISRQIFQSSSIAVGGLQLFASPAVSDSPENTYYVAFSHAVQSLPSRSSSYSRLNYTIGFGTGRFLRKSPKDVAAGKGRYGTGLFANISYELIPRINLNAEWSGLNLGFSLGVRPMKKSALTMGFGVFNLTRYSGDRITYLATAGLPISTNKTKHF